jgi:hypothetical protein
MSKMSSLDLVLDEMITAGQKMIEAATALKEIFSETAVPKKATEAPVKEVAPEPEIKKYTFQELRGVMASLSGKGKKAEAKALLTKYGASRLSEVKEADYAALVAEAEVILND